MKMLHLQNIRSPNLYLFVSKIKQTVPKIATKFYEM